MRGIKSKLFTFAALLAVVCCLFAFSNHKASAAAGINPQINFQGKLTNPDGTNVTDGSYSIVFSIYSVSSGGTAIWTETQSTVAVSSGIFQVALGSVTALPGSVDFNSTPLYLGVKVGTDPEMTPRIQFTAAPYAFNSAELGGLSSTGFVQLANGIQADASTASSIAINKTGASGNILQLQKGGVDVFDITNGGAIQTASASYQSNLFTINDGAAAIPTIPSTYLPSFTVATGETSGSRPLFFGYPNLSGTSWDSYLDAGACGSFTTMCFDLGSGATSYTALENVGTTLNVGGGDDGNFTNVAFNNTGASTFTSSGVFNNGITLNSGTAKQLSITSGTNVPTVDQAVIDNTGSTGVAAAGVNGLDVKYKGGAAAVEAGGIRIDFTPGGTAAGTWDGLHIVANTTGAVTGVAENGIKLDGPTSPGAGTEVALNIDANWDVGLQLGAKTTDPATPATNNLYVYAREVDGRSLLRQKNSSGVSFAYQPALFEQNVFLVTPNSGATALVPWGGNALTSAGTLSTPAVAQASGYQTNFATAAVAASLGGESQTNTQWFTGNVAGSNGFFQVNRLYFPDASYGAGTTGSRIWTGLTDAAVGTTMTNADNPTGNYAGFQYSTNRGDTNWQFMTKNGTTQNIINTGMAFLVSKLYDFYVYTPPQGTTIFWRVDNLTDGTTQEGSTATNLPTNTTALRSEFQLQTLTTTARNIRFSKLYVESDR